MTDLEYINSKEYPELEKKGFKIVNVLESNSDKLIQKIVGAYKNVFNNSAWREGVKCEEGCGFKATFEKSPKNCPDCEGGIVDFYSDNDVREAINAIIEQPGYKQLLALIDDEERVGGFTWGWNTALDKLSSEKLSLTDTQYGELIDNLLKLGIDTENPLYYQSETGIIGVNRGKGLGGDIVTLNQQILEDNQDNVSSIIQRTSEGSPMFSIREKQGYEVVFEYKDQDKRVIFAKNNI